MEKTFAFPLVFLPKFVVVGYYLDVPVQQGLVLSAGIGRMQRWMVLYERTREHVVVHKFAHGLISEIGTSKWFAVRKKRRAKEVILMWK